MNGQLQHELAKSYRMDLVDAIEKAQEGYLSPSVQEYCFEEIEKTWGTEEYPPDGDSLFAQLREVLGTHTQISDREQAEMELQALGVELLFYVNVDRFTFAEITHLRREDKYDGRIYINGEKHRDDLVECVGVMKKEFGDWLANAEIFFNRTKVQVRCPDSCDGHFDTLEEAIALVYDGLEDPEKLL